LKVNFELEQIHYDSRIVIVNMYSSLLHPTRYGRNVRHSRDGVFVEEFKDRRRGGIPAWISGGRVMFKSQKKRRRQFFERELEGLSNEMRSLRY